MFHCLKGVTMSSDGNPTEVTLNWLVVWTVGGIPSLLFDQQSVAIRQETWQPLLNGNHFEPRPIPEEARSKSGDWEGGAPFLIS